MVMLAAMHLELTSASRFMLRLAAAAASPGVYVGTVLGEGGGVLAMFGVHCLVCTLQAVCTSDSSVFLFLSIRPIRACGMSAVLPAGTASWYCQLALPAGFFGWACCLAFQDPNVKLITPTELMLHGYHNFTPGPLHPPCSCRFMPLSCRHEATGR
jgi:hypothetical protein